MLGTGFRNVIHSFSGVAEHTSHQFTNVSEKFESINRPDAKDSVVIYIST